MAASSFYDARRSCYRLNGVDYDADELGAYYARLHFTYPQLRYVEDPFAEHDSAQFARYAKAHRDMVVIGDDLTTTNRQSLIAAAKADAISGIIIKPNQIGTVSDTLGTMREAYRRRVRCIVSHRSGETTDDFIADLAWGTRCFGLKAGAPRAPERRVKYERLRALATE
jgi:enolase